MARIPLAPACKCFTSAAGAVSRTLIYPTTQRVRCTACNFPPGTCKTTSTHMTTIEYDNAPARRKNVETDVSSPIFELLVLVVKMSNHFQREGLYLNLFEYFGLIRDFEPFL